MRVHTEKTDQYIQTLANATRRDPLSLSEWQCVHFSHIEDVPKAWYEETIKRLKDSNPEADCDIVHCPDNDVLFISRNSQACELQELANQFSHAALYDHGIQGEVTSYSLMHDWWRISNLLLNKVPVAPAEDIPSAAYDFGEIASLKEVFEEARKKRRARAPQYVMIVEDDPLTRRIVSNSLKEGYALITVSTAQEAIANYLMHAPDIVFLDIGLPDTDGFNVLHQIMVSDPEAYVVMFSSNSYLENVVNALGAGACGFVAKPFRKDLLTHYITNSALHHAKQA